jgi:anti-anti-sigma regulatory factor
MSNVKAIDETGFSTMLTFYEQFTAKGRYSAILDPSPETESFIKENELESKIPVFGTEKAFEENALKTKKNK